MKIAAASEPSPAANLRLPSLRHRHRQEARLDILRTLIAKLRNTSIQTLAK